jgi:hypothetical protein
MRRSTDPLTIRILSLREREAVEIIGARPGITVEELREAGWVSRRPGLLVSSLH